MGDSDPITGKDVVAFMQRTGMEASQLAKRVGCSRQTVYTWRGSSFRDRPIVGRYTETLRIAMADNWDLAYRKALRSFIRDSARSLVFWHFLRHSGLKEEVLIVPRFKAYGLDTESTTFPDILHEWSQPQHKPRLVVGSSGLGKTTFVRLAVLELLSKSKGILPLVAPLGLFSSWVADGEQDGDFADFLSYVYSVLSLEPAHMPEMLARLREGTALLLLDGVDEIPPAKHGMFLDLLGRFLERLPGPRKVIITSRLLDFQTLGRLRAWCSVLELTAFSQTQRRELAEHLLPQQQVRAFLQALTDYPSVRQIASKPLTLSIMLSMFRHAGVIEFTEAAVLEFLFDFTFGKYQGARSLGGYVERDNALMYLTSPAAVRATVYSACYKLRCRQPHGRHYPVQNFQATVADIWRERGSVPEAAISAELNALLMYLAQLGVISDLYGVGSTAFDYRGHLSFASELVLDWLAAAHLVSHPEDLDLEVREFSQADIPVIPASQRRRMFYAMELLNSTFHDPRRVDSVATALLDSCVEHCHVTEQLLRVRFLFLVDCLRRGLITSYQLKRKIRIHFRRLFEQNNYALVQKALQARVLILDPGQELNLEIEEPYLNPFKPERLPPHWSPSKKGDWQTRILQQRYEESAKLHPNLESFRDDMSWRYGLSIALLRHQLPKVRAARAHIHSPDAFVYRRFMFAARFVSLNDESPSDVEYLLRELLALATDQARYEKVLQYMALDSVWYLLSKIANLLEFLPTHPLSELDIVGMRGEYFTVARDHTYFRAKYCDDMSWTFTALLDDSRAQAHYMIIEHKGVAAAVEDRNWVGDVSQYSSEIQSFVNEMAADPKIRPNHKLLNRLAKLCIAIAFAREPALADPHAVPAIRGLAADTQKHSHMFNIGPRQLYDYAVFALWSLFEYEAEEVDVLPF